MGNKHGFGTYQWKDGSKYVGSWDDNKITGIGIYEWLDGRSYQGEWSKNNHQGIGIYKWKDGREYKGEYYLDLKHGYGTFTWEDGRSYTGYWAKGRQHGLGIYRKPAENRVDYGLWEEGKGVKYFDLNMQNQINGGLLTYTQYFQKQDSQLLLPKGCTFKEPANHRRSFV